MQKKEKELYYDYVDGIGSHGPILKRFSSILTEYKNNYAKWKPFQDENLEERAEILRDEPKSMMKVAIVCFVITLLLYPGGKLSFAKGVTYIVFSFIAGFVIQFKNEKDGWFVALPIGTILWMIMGGLFQVKFYCWFLLICFGCYGGWAFWLRKKNIERYVILHNQNLQEIKEQKELEEHLKNRKKQLQELLPKLKEEYQNLRTELLKQSGNGITENEQYKELPEVFWWEVLPEQLYEIEQKLWKNRDDSYNYTWETKAVKRISRKEYEYAEAEFSPLYPKQQEFDYNSKRVECKENGGMIIDFVSLILSSYPTSETVKYTEYRYGALERFSKSMEWDALGQDIENSYKEGILGEENYRSLKSRYNNLDYDVYKKINEEVENTYTRDREVRTATLFWEGQMLLFPDEQLHGGFVLTDYRCQFENLYENINTLQGYNITRVMGDVAERNPVFLAKIHQMFPECR